MYKERLKEIIEDLNRNRDEIKSEMENGIDDCYLPNLLHQLDQTQFYNEVLLDILERLDKLGG